jgi:uncharacterized protein (TIGR03790 family)
MVAVVLSLSASPAANAELLPDELAVLAMEQSETSRALAEHYVRARGLPEGRICLLPGEPNVELSRAEWDATLRPAIRRWLREQQLVGRVRCLVTTWDVPLRIGAAEPSPELAEFLAAQRSLRIGRLNALLAEAQALLSTSEEDPAALPDDATARDAAVLVQQVMTDLQQRAAAEEDEASRTAAAAAQEQFGFQAGGLTAALSVAQTSPEPDLAALAALRGQLQGINEGLNAQGLLRESVERAAATLPLADRVGGSIGAIGWIDEQQRLAAAETYASFDSELSLVLWPSHALARWLPNLLHHRFDGSPLRDVYSTLLVSRLEAPTPELAQGLIDTSIAIEQTGLEGKFYIDARGIAVEQPRSHGAYGDYDEALRELAGDLAAYSDLPATLDDRSELFQDGDCPEAALYCGWYSLSNYVDAFEWRPGAVAYHIASGEAATLRDAASNVWCKRMLEDGVCATLGPVHEPYLAAFPRPDEFFALLLTGKYSLAECYGRTLPLGSWVMTLVGDPLYNPFRAHPRLKEEQLPERLQWVRGP